MPALPEGYEWADELDPVAGFLCPHGNYIEPDGEASFDGCRNPAILKGWL